MRSRIINEAKVFEVRNPLNIGDDIVLPAGRYDGCMEWAEIRMRSGELRKTKAICRMHLQADDIRRFGGDVSPSTKGMTFDISAQVKKGTVV